MCGERVWKKGKARPEELGVVYRRGDALKTVWSVCVYVCVKTEIHKRKREFL